MGATGVTAARPHRLSDAALASLGAGRPGPATLAELRRARLSRHLLLLREIAVLARTEDFAALAAAERAAPDRVRELLARPLFGVWAARCLTALRAGATPDSAGTGHLSELAARARIPRPRREDGRQLTAEYDGLRITVRLEDTDPLRAELGLPPTAALDAAEHQRWQTLFAGAWRLLVDRVRPDAEVLAGLLDCVVPVRTDPAARGISATSADAFGAVAISEPADATALAVGLLHEIQHSILNGVQYLFDLLEEPGELGYSPWRDDPRPASGILHGAYAYLTVTRFWRTRRDPLGQFEFARWRAAVATAAGDLRGLTPAGERFVGALLGEVRPWLDEPVDPRVRRLAEGANRDHRLRWRLRNLHVGPADAAALADAWRRGERPPPVTPVLRPAPRRALEASARLDLTHRLLRGLPLDGAAGDLAYVRGDDGAALSAYRKNPGDRAAWAGMVLAGGLDAAPELAAAAYRALGDQERPDPLAMVKWVS
ncbi:hypothetical protein Asp14428_35010 [Actinoplanes sp. NBRC 14428]|nr:hypothetical protein Asp14428_35010 [Actinoplanes sp. NBRC 14428]